MKMGLKFENKKSVDFFNNIFFGVFNTLVKKSSSQTGHFFLIFNPNFQKKWVFVFFFFFVPTPCEVGPGKLDLYRLGGRANLKGGATWQVWPRGGFNFQTSFWNVKMGSNLASMAWEANSGGGGFKLDQYSWGDQLHGGGGGDLSWSADQLVRRAPYLKIYLPWSLTEQTRHRQGGVKIAEMCHRQALVFCCKTWVYDENYVNDKGGGRWNEKWKLKP